ncbi:arsenic resistance N-acetyltransferase ArsN2 [Methyloraptor flagellatus]|uniref:Arsenate reductase n=1 Tax=Methyloraptor flagellatus TaxID=3162530 RepID=A0AAU7X5T3_9HYPH
MTAITIYHNPACGTSSNVLALLRRAGPEPRVIEYLTTPPSGAELVDFAARMGLPLKALLREKGTPFEALDLGRAGITDAEILAAIAEHPILINRPIVVAPAGVRLCRPSDVVLDLIDAPRERLTKDDDAPYLKDEPVGAAEIAAPLQAAGLHIEDIAEPGRSFFRYRTLDGATVGWGGFEIHGADALLRSIVVEPPARGTRIGRNLVALLMRRAFDRGATRAYLATRDAAPFFAACGFKPIAREALPPAIAATRQLADLCPASATVMSRRITL